MFKALAARGTEALGGRSRSPGRIGFFARERERDGRRVLLRVRGELEVGAGKQRTLIATAVHELLPAEAITMPTGKAWM